MTEYLSQHHGFDIHLASKYGIEEAILIHHFQHWIQINKKLNRNFHEGRTWTYQTLDEIAAHFPYLNKSKVFDTLEKLCNGKPRKSKNPDKHFDPVLIKGNFNTNRYDRTIWYAFFDEPKWILGNPKIENGEPQNHDWENPTPIPDTKPYTKTKEEEPPNPLKGEVTKVTAPKCEKKSFGSHVKLKESEYESLCKDNGEEVVKDIINQINDYILSKGKKPYNDYAATIRQWLRRNKDKNPIISSSSVHQINSRSQIDRHGNKVENPLEGVF